MSTEKEVKEEEIDPTAPIEEKETFNLELGDNATVLATINRTKVKSNPEDETFIEYTINLELELKGTSDNIQLHWAVYKQDNAGNWIHPLEKYYPKNTTDSDKNSVNTLFENNKIIFDYKINSKDENLFQGINFVFQNLSNGKWYNNNGQNYRIEIIKREKGKSNPDEESELIIPDCIKNGMDMEANYGTWCLMHRYQKVRDCIFLLNLENPNEAIWIYIWLLGFIFGFDIVLENY